MCINWKIVKYLSNIFPYKQFCSYYGDGMLSDNVVRKETVHVTEF